MSERIAAAELPKLPTGVTMERLLRLLAAQKRQIAKRAAFYRTEEGKKYNCEKAAAYYEKNKEAIRLKNLERYHAKKLTDPAGV